MTMNASDYSPLRLEWSDPELIDLNKSMADVESAAGPTADVFAASSS